MSQSHPPTQSGVHAYSPNAGNTVGLCFIAVILPPIPVYLVRGFHADLLINFLLFIFGYVPAIAHAMYIVITDTRPKSGRSQGEKYDISKSRHTPSPVPRTSRPSMDPANTTNAPPSVVVRPFLAGGSGVNSHPTGGAGSVPAIEVSTPQPTANVNGHHQVPGAEEAREERDLPVYEEVVSPSSSRIKQETVQSYCKA